MAGKGDQILKQDWVNHRYEKRVELFMYSHVLVYNNAGTRGSPLSSSVEDLFTLIFTITIYWQIVIPMYFMGAGKGRGGYFPLFRC